MCGYCVPELFEVLCALWLTIHAEHASVVISQWNSDPGSLFQHLATWFQHPGRLFQDPGTQFQDPGIMPVPGSWNNVQGSWNTVPGSRNHLPGSWINVPGYMDLDRNIEVQETIKQRLPGCRN